MTDYTEEKRISSVPADTHIITTTNTHLTRKLCDK